MSSLGGQPGEANTFLLVLCISQDHDELFSFFPYFFLWHIILEDTNTVHNKPGQLPKTPEGPLYEVLRYREFGKFLAENSDPPLMHIFFSIPQSFRITKRASLIFGNMRQKNFVSAKF